MARKPLRIYGRRSDNDFQIGALRQQFAQIPEDKVDIQAAFVRFIDNQRVVLHQQPILLDFRQQNTVGHQLDQRIFTDLIVKAHLITDAAAERRFQLIGNAVCYGARRQAPWLGMADQPLHPTPQLQADLRQLGGFPRTGFPGDNHYLMVTDRVQDILLFLADRQVFRIGDFRARGGARLHFLQRSRNVTFDFSDGRLLSIGIFDFSCALQPTLQALLITEHQFAQLGSGCRERRFHVRYSLSHRCRIKL
ncbi:hypothetical protein D3C79_394280 [compost metagenome]